MYNKAVKPNFKNIGEWDFYCNDLLVEYTQCFDEGLDVEKYKDIFDSIAALPPSEEKKNLSDALFNAVSNAEMRENYKYNEPSELHLIKELRKPHSFKVKSLDENTLKRKISGALFGRICGCLLGKPVEGIRSDEFIPFLKQSNNYPLHRYILSTDVTEEMCNTYKFNLRNKCYADTVHGMPVDDDTNYIALGQLIIEKYGKEFSPADVADAWLKNLGKDSFFTAERVAYFNFINGYEPPLSAMYKNPYREWIGAQIRGDYYGYINPGNPELSADMAFRDASISHVKNGIYGEMWASAMISCAAVTDNIEDIIKGGLAQIPSSSRLFEAVTNVIDSYKNKVSYDECCNTIHNLFDEHTGYGWCHTIPNAMIVTAALLYGDGDFGKSICLAVQASFDTDCNGATVGSVLGMRNGIDCIDESWTKPLEDTLHTSIFGVGTVKISEMVEKTLNHIN